MKRGGPLRRSELKRGRELRADAEKVREFLRRGRGSLERAPLKRTGGMRRASRAEGPLTPAGWRQAVHDASEGRCLMTGTRSRDVDDPRFHPHHCLAKRELRARGLLGYVWDARNGIWVSADVHERHENASKRIPAERLPRSVWEFCSELDALDGTAWATALVLRVHPPAGLSGISHEEDQDGEGRERHRRQRD